MRHRQLRLRVLEAIERRVKQFRSREELWPLRVPHEPLSLDAVIDDTLGDERRGFDVMSLRSRTILRLEWSDGSAWDAWAIVLPSQVKVYCDSGDDESRILASGGRNEGDATDRLFLELLSTSRGEHFGIEMSGDAPSRVRSSIADRAFLVDVFVELFEGSDIEDAIRDTLSSDVGNGLSGSDFRADVDRWLVQVMR
jgi:hypothetical protein